MQGVEHLRLRQRLSRAVEPVEYLPQRLLVIGRHDVRRNLVFPDGLRGGVDDLKVLFGHPFGVLPGPGEQGRGG
jgi:hypothetical protein